MVSSIDVGNLMYLYLDEIEPGQGTDTPDFLIKASASLINQNGGRNWIPIVIKAVGKDQYEEIGNSFVYAVAEEAGLERIWCIVADESDNTALITRVL